MPLDGSHYRVTCCACSSSAVTPVLPNAQPDRGGIAHRLRPLGQGREVPMGCGRWRVSSMCSINRRRAATFWRDRPSPLAMSMSDRISASICRTARSKARLSRTFSSSPRATLNERSREPVGDHSDRARGQKSAGSDPSDGPEHVPITALCPPTSELDGERPMAGMGVRRDKAALSSGCEAHPANRSSRKQPEQAWRRRSV